jgi:hypothetical protein
MTSLTAEASPLYLNCFTQFEKLSKERFSVQLNEESRQVIHTGVQGTFKAFGVFTPGKIIYQQLRGDVFGLITLHKYEISRSTLQVTEFTISPATETRKSSSTISPGSCLVAKQGKDKTP